MPKHAQLSSGRAWQQCHAHVSEVSLAFCSPQARAASLPSSSPSLTFLSHLQTCLSVQFSRSVVSQSLRPHELQHARPPCPSPTPRVHPNPRASSRLCHPAISSSVGPSPPALNLSQHQVQTCLHLAPNLPLKAAFPENRLPST